MPTWPDPAAFARELERLESDLARDEARRITKKMAEEARTIAYRVASSDLGGDPRFSGWEPWLELQVKSARRSGHLLMPTKRSAGPWTVAEQGRNQGNGGGGAFLGPGVNRRTGATRFRSDGTVAKVRAFRSKRWNGYTVGKRTATKAEQQIESATAPIADREVKKALRRRFDVT